MTCNLQGNLFVLGITLSLSIYLSLGACGRHMYHFTRTGETLYSIGWIYGYDYRQLAKWNKIPAPYTLKPGQRLRVAPLAGELQDTHEVAGKLTVSWRESKETRNKAVTKAVKQKARKPANHPVKSPVGPRKSVAQAKPAVWYWPTKPGKVIQRYHAHEPGKRGLQLSGRKGQAIFSAADGRVVYSGSGLTRYGKLIIVKHNDTFLSAYAHNHRLLVKEGDRIRAGQKIAEMGSTGTNRVKLHFEIRRNGKPVDPLRYLPKQMR